jgi:hypothetical protein
VLSFLLGTAGVALLVSRLWKAHAERAIKKALVLAERDATLLLPFEQKLRGRSITRGWNYVRSERRGSGRDSHDVDLYRYVTTAHGVLPGWVLIGWEASRPVPTKRSARDRNELLIYALFQASAVQNLPAGATLSASRGDLTLESPERVGQTGSFSEVYTQALVELALSFQSLEEKRVIARLEEQVVEEPMTSADALRLLIKSFRDHEATQRALAHARSSKHAVLRALAASSDGDAGRGALRDIALDLAAPEAARIEAIEGLVALQDVASLVEVGAGAPSSSARALIDTLSKKAVSGANEVLVAFLRSPDLDLVEAAADALARVGTREAVGPLQRRAKAGGVPERLRTAIEVAVELIQDRAGGTEQRGSLALAAGDEGGQLSVAEPTGALAIASRLDSGDGRS